MKAKTEELLYLLLWTCDMLMRPTFRNISDSFESWAYRNGLYRQLCELERRKLLERLASPQSNQNIERACRLTEAGRLHAIGGRDPEACWRTPWDGKWRLVLFDVPNNSAAIRDQLRYRLVKCGFGYLQNSVWISPHPLKLPAQVLVGSKLNVESLVMFEARPCAGETDEEIVLGSWNFGAINRRYAEYLNLLARRPNVPIKKKADAEALRRWAAKERVAWLNAVSHDPLLPERLLPRDYLGRIAWGRRVKEMQAVATHIRSAKMPYEWISRTRK